MCFKFRKSQDVCDEVLEDIEHSSSLGPGEEKKRYESYKYTSERKWVSTASQMVERFKETGYFIFESASAMSRGILRRQNGRRHHTRQCGCCEHRTLISNASLSKSAQ